MLKEICIFIIKSLQDVTIQDFMRGIQLENGYIMNITQTIESFQLLDKLNILL